MKPTHTEYPFDSPRNTNVIRPRYGVARSLDRSEYYIYDRWNRGKIVMRENCDSLSELPPERDQMMNACAILNEEFRAPGKAETCRYAKSIGLDPDEKTYTPIEDGEETRAEIKCAMECGHLVELAVWFTKWGNIYGEF